MHEQDEPSIEEGRKKLEDALERVQEGQVGCDVDRSFVGDWRYIETVRADFIEAFGEDARRRMVKERKRLISQSIPAMEPSPPEITENEESPKKYIISTRTLIVSIFLLTAYVGVDFLVATNNKREKTACELLQKGQPLPNAPSEVQLPTGDSLYKLVDACETTHGVDITYGCAAEGILRTAGLNHEPSEISEELRAEAFRIAQEVKCNQ